MDELLLKAKSGFLTLKVRDEFKVAALLHLKTWLGDAQFVDYVPQIKHLIDSGYWDYLLDSFYQVIPFGTSGRRGEVGVGPNRINQFTIRASAQGHSLYLLKTFGDAALSRGVVLAWDTRQFFGNKFLHSDLPCPIFGLDGKMLAQAAAEVYAGNGLKVYLFDTYRTTPELSYSIRRLNCVSGSMFSASHNPPDHNGIKVYDERGGLLMPPYDEQLIEIVNAASDSIEAISFDDAQKQNLAVAVPAEVDEDYLAKAAGVSLSQARDISIVYSPLHGCGRTSVEKVLERLGYVLKIDPVTAEYSGKFEGVTFNIPNPEVTQSFDRSLVYAKEVNADLLLSTDPDADRIGIMVHHDKNWIFLNGNEIAAILVRYAIDKKAKLVKKPVVVKTGVTTNLIKTICEAANVELKGDLLVGFKYIAEEVRILDEQGRIDDFLIGAEESHGYIAGDYSRDKDACIGAVWLSELAAELKKQQKTLVDYLHETYRMYGYFRNKLTEIRLPGAEGKSMIDKIQDTLRKTPPTQAGRFAITKFVDHWNDLPFISQTDKSNKDVLEFTFAPIEGTASIRAVVRPSGNEPKTKLYIEIGTVPFGDGDFSKIEQFANDVASELERELMKSFYKIIGVDFPDRGFLLFWQLPLPDKMKYFEVEKDLIALKDVADVGERKKKMEELFKFLGADPVAKVDDAFKAEYKVGILEYLQLA